MANIYSALIILAGLLGILTGSFLSITFFRLETIWKRFFVSVLIGGSPIPGLVLIFSQFTPTDETKIWCYIIYILCLLISFVGILIFLIKRLKPANDNSLSIRDTDILLGYKNAITDYYEQRKKEADLNIQKLEEWKDSIAKKEQECRIKEDLINEKNKALSEQINKSISITFPENYTVPISADFINGLPGRSNQFQQFAFYSSILAEDLGNRFKKSVTHKNDKEDQLAATKLREFAWGICSYATQYLFSEYIRIHFRYLHNNKTYLGLVTSFDRDGHTHQITPIPVSETNLISHSSKINRSLIRNFNSEQDFSSTSKRWVNYLTIGLNDHVFLNENKDPILSMGISIPDNDSYEGMIRFLNFIGFERIVEQVFLQFHGYVNCKKAINYLSSQPLN